MAEHFRPWPGAWIGVDFDGTLAHSVAWDPVTNTLPLGDPIPEMIQRVKDWIAQGIEVRVFTARVGCCGLTNQQGVRDDEGFANTQASLIHHWTARHIGQPLEVTAVKDMNCLAIFDDRAVQIEHNTGRILGEWNGPA